MSPAPQMSPEGSRALGGLLAALAGPAPALDLDRLPDLRAQLTAPGTFTTDTDAARTAAPTEGDHS